MKSGVVSRRSPIRPPAKDCYVGIFGAAVNVTSKHSTGRTGKLRITFREPRDGLPGHDTRLPENQPLPFVVVAVERIFQVLPDLRGRRGLTFRMTAEPVIGAQAFPHV